MKTIKSGGILLVGGGGHAKAIIDALNDTDTAYGILEKDSDQIGKTVCGIPVIGTDAEIDTLQSRGFSRFILGCGHVGNYQLRKKLFRRFLEAGFAPVNIIHPTAWVSPYAHIGQGNAVLAGAVINAGTVLGDNNIVNTRAVVEHDVQGGCNIHFAPGSVVCGGSVIGSDTLIGAGAVVIQCMTVGERVLVGAGSTVTRPVADDTRALGSPARCAPRFDHSV